MYKISYNGTIIDSNLRSLVLPKEGDKVVCNGALYIVQTVDLNMDENDLIEDITVGVLKESDLEPENND